MEKTVVVKQTEGNEVPAEVLATSIVKISSALQQWNSAGLRRHALVVLLVASTRVCKRDVEAVLNGIGALRTDYLLPTPTAAKK